MRAFQYVSIIACIGVLTACGKVIQEAPKQIDTSIFDITYSAKLSEPTPKPPYAPWSLREMTVYIDVSQIDSDGKILQESSGKSTLKKRDSSEKTSTSNNAYTATAFRPDGTILTGAADYKWSKATFDAKAMAWSIDSKKIKRGAPFYRIALFTDANTAKLKIVDEKTVSKNASISIGEITSYDTFLATLFCASLTLDKAVIDIPKYFDDLSKFYSQDLFQVLTLKPAENTAIKFNTQTPAFVFSGTQEIQLLSLYDLYRNNPTEVLAALKKNTYPWLTDKAKAIITKTIDSQKSVPR